MHTLATALLGQGRQVGHRRHDFGPRPSLRDRIRPSLEVVEGYALERVVPHELVHHLVAELVRGQGIVDSQVFHRSLLGEPQAPSSARLRGTPRGLRSRALPGRVGYSIPRPALFGNAAFAANHPSLDPILESFYN